MLKTWLENSAARIGRVVVTGLLLLCPATTFAEDWNALLGLSQPLLMNGGNIEVNYLTKRFVFEYSHGFSLDLSARTASRSLLLSADERRQGLEVRVPYSTGGGVGYRFTEAFNVRLELKQHKFDVEHPSGEKISYTTRDLGVGAYYFWFPCKSKHLLVVPSIRYWPTIDTSLRGDEYVFANGDRHKAHEFGLFGNISVGLRF